MFRTPLVSILALFLAAGAIVFAAGQSAETPLGQCTAGSDTLRVLLREGSDGKSALAISVGGESSRQSFNLKTPCLDRMEKTLASPLKLDAVDAADANNLVAGFGIAGADGDARWVSVWLNKSGGRWSMRGEWFVEKFNHKELGEKNETHAFAFDASGMLLRSATRHNVEGIRTTCPQGCCVAWQSKTLVTEEIETLAWNAPLSLLERKLFQKWYFAMHGDGLLSIAQKVYGNPLRMATLLRLNPELQKQDTLNDDQKVLIESVTR